MGLSVVAGPQSIILYIIVSFIRHDPVKHSHGCALGACPSVGFQKLANQKKIDFRKGGLEATEAREACFRHQMFCPVPLSTEHFHKRAI